MFTLLSQKWTQECRDGLFTIYLYEKKTEQDMMEMMRILVENHILVQKMEMLEPNLEDLFMEVAGR